MAIEFKSSGKNVELFFENEKLLVTEPRRKLQLSGKDFLPKFSGTIAEDIPNEISFYIADLPEELSHLSAIVLDNINKYFELTLMTRYFDRDSWARRYSFAEYISQLESLISACIPPIKPYQKTECFKHSNLSTLSIKFKLSQGDIVAYILECAAKVAIALDEADRLLVAKKTTKRSVQKSKLKFNEGAHCGLEEDQTIEFKEIKGNNPKQSIQKPLDKYIISFLNSEGGSIYWGITDDGIVKGVKLTTSNKDDINKSIVAVINNIVPSIDPTKVQVTYHAVENMEDHYVLEVCVSKSRLDSLYFNKSDETWVRLNGVSRYLKGLELQEYILERFSTRT